MTYVIEHTMTDVEANAFVREILTQKSVFFRSRINYLGDTGIVDRIGLKDVPYEERYQDGVLFLGADSGSNVSRYVENGALDYIKLLFNSNFPKVCCCDKDKIELYIWIKKDMLSDVDVAFMQSALRVRHKLVYHMDLDTKKIVMSMYERKKCRDIRFRKRQDKIYSAFDMVYSGFVNLCKSTCINGR